MASAEEETGFGRWVYDTYVEQLALADVEGSQKFRRFLTSMTSATFDLSGALRAQSFHIIKYGYPLRRAGYTAATFTASVLAADGKRAETTYAYAYWPRSAEGGASAPEYVCVSPTFASRDGEFRHRFVWWPQFARGYEGLAEQLSPTEAALLEMVAAGALEIDATLYPRDPAAAESVEGLRLCVRTLAAAVALHHISVQQPHVTSSHVAVMGALAARCAETLDVWRGPLHSSLTAFSNGRPGAPHRTECGQKLVPLTVRDALQTGDINFAPWREVWVARAVTDLVINGVAAGFPIFGNWSYLSGVDRFAFEGGAMRARFARSESAERTVESLREARAAGAADRETDYRVGQLDAHVYDALEYAQGYVTLTDLALLSTVEYLGNTVAAVAELPPGAEAPEVTAAFDAGDDEIATRLLFDLCYSAHALHRRVGAVHADLHLNNMTIFAQSPWQSSELLEDGSVRFYDRYGDARFVAAFVAGDGGEADTYVLPHKGVGAYIIDFSRALLGPDARPRLVAEFGEAFAETFYRAQVSRVLRALHVYAPDYVEKHQEVIKGRILTDFAAVFRALTAVDFLAVGRNFGSLLRGSPAPPAAAAALAADLERAARAALVKGLAAVVRGGPAPPSAGDVLLPAVFKDFTYGAWAARGGLRGRELADVLNVAAPMPFSGDDHARFPPWARLADLGAHLGGIPAAAVTAFRGERPFLESRSLDGLVEALQAQLRADRGGDAPAAATSSWIAD